MPGPTPYNYVVSIPLPADDEIREVLGASYDPAKALNVVKMFAGCEDKCPATSGLVQAVFAAEGVDPRPRKTNPTYNPRLRALRYNPRKALQLVGIEDSKVMSTAQDCQGKEFIDAMTVRMAALATLKNAPSSARLLSTGLSNSYSAHPITTSLANATTSAAMPRRNRPSEAEMLCAVLAALPSTTILPRTDWPGLSQTDR